MTDQLGNLKVQQVNCFYNYTIGLDVINVDLLKTAAKLLKSGIVSTVCFSDLKAVYLDEDGKTQIEWIQPQGRRWDDSWTVKFNESLPKHIADDLVFCLELSFHERRIENSDGNQMPPYLRAALPPIILENDNLSFPIYPWLKLQADGIMFICFQLDTIWEGLPEKEFIRDIVNLFQRYFNRIWVQAELQRLDGENIMPNAFSGAYSIGGQSVVNRKARKHVKKMEQIAKTALDESLGKEGTNFDLHGKSWKLHQIAGSEDQTEWEGTIDLCRDIYANALASLVVETNHLKNNGTASIQLWQGRPSISLMRYVDQPETKNQLLEMFDSSLSRILLRSPVMQNPPQLPTDLRPFNDYCFHGNRALLLWTWLRSNSEPENAWADPNTTRSRLLENQARAEHFEYHNMLIARACATARTPPSDEYLLYAYETLTEADAVIHHASQAGEISEALDFLLTAAGTTKLIASGKEQARWHLDERRFRNEIRRYKMDRWLVLVFGLVSAAGLAELVGQPYLKAKYSSLVDWNSGLFAFLITTAILFSIYGLAAIVNKVRRN